MFIQTKLVIQVVNAAIINPDAAFQEFLSARIMSPECVDLSTLKIKNKHVEFLHHLQH